jgi:hypothetical protein
MPCVLLALALGACASSTRIQQLTAATTLPKRVAVLPMSGGNLDPEFAQLVRVQIGNVFEQRGYVKFDDGWVDHQLARSGMRPWDTAWLPVDEMLCFWGVANDIDGIVLLEDFQSGDVKTLVYNERSLTGRFRVLDARAGHSTWIFDIGTRESGGLLLQSGQVFDTLSTFAATQRAQFEAIAASLALAITADLPDTKAAQPIGRRPVVDSVAVTALPGGGRLEVVVHGTPGCRAFASLPQSTGRYPLVEQSPGRYVGTLTLPAGQLPAGSPSNATAVVGVLRDRIGASSKPVSQPIAAGGGS